MWLKDDDTKVVGLVRDIFGLPGTDPALWVGERPEGEFPCSQEEVRGWVL